MKALIVISMLSLFMSSSSVFAHGEDKPGPHSGFIRMPGGFHTEVIPLSQNQLKVYLLDIQWKNPSIANSNLSMTLKAKKKAQAKCSVEADHYICDFPKSVDLKKKGELFVEAQRENQKGNVVSYDLPLKLQVVDDGHGGHH